MFIAFFIVIKGLLTK